MKKGIFGVLFFLGFLFVSLVSNVDVVMADTSATVTTDSYDSRKISIELVGLSTRTDLLKVHEVVSCTMGEENCNDYTIAGNEVYLKIITTKSYDVNVDDSLTALLQYTILSEGDGTKYFYIEAFQGETPLTGSSCYFEHQLSTLTQRVIVNPDGNGNPLHVYDHKQYSSVRKLNISVDLYQEEYEVYTGVVYVCEIMGEEFIHCGDYMANQNSIDYYLTSYGDGQKYLSIYLVKVGNSIGDTNNIFQELKNEATLISKDIYLDTIGPEISVDGGNWIFIDSGEKYTEQKATCSDSVFGDDECIVTNDYGVVGIDYSSNKYQLITYEASDRLGNVTNVAVKVKVNQEVKDNSLLVGLLVGGGVMVVTFAILGYVLLKNHEKKKKLSYI